MDRLEIKLVGELPDAGKYRILAAAEETFRNAMDAFNGDHKMALAIEVKAVSPAPRKPKVAAAVSDEAASADTATVEDTAAPGRRRGHVQQAAE
jgi:hypothetical protein